MSLKDFKNILKCLSKYTESIKDELINLYVEINSSKSIEPTIDNISAECVQYLSFNLQLNPYPTVVLIQQLLCLWNPKFHRTDNMLQDLYIDTLDILINRLESGYETTFTIVKLYSLLSQLQLTPIKMDNFKTRIIPKLLNIVKNNKINEKQLYLCLLSQHNLQILRQIFAHKAVNSTEILNNTSDIFLQCLKTKQHWFQIMIFNSTLNKNEISTEFIEILNFIRLIIEANSSSLELTTIENIDKLLLNITNIYQIDNFIKDFSLEMHRQILIIKFCLEHSSQKDPNIHSIFEVIRGNSCLSTLSRFIDLSDIKIWPKCLQMLKFNRESQPDIYTIDPKTMVPPNWDIILFRAYCIMINLIQCVTTVVINHSEQYFLHITSVLNVTKQEILNLEKLELQVEVVENIFSLIFIRYEHYSEDEEIDVTKKLSGFVCNELILRDILDMLKYCINEIKSGVNLSELDSAFNKRILKIEKYVNEGLSRLYFLTNDTFFHNVGVFSDPLKIDYCRCDENSGTNIEQYYLLDVESSDSESDLNYDRSKNILTSIESRSTTSQEVVDNKTVISRTNSFLSDVNTSSIDDNIRITRRRKLQARRSETEKSSEGSETTASSGKSRRKYPKRSSNNDAIRERRFLLNFMLSSPQSLLCLCLAQGDYERVQKVVNMYNLEKTHIASNVLFTKNLRDLRTQLQTLFEKVEPEDSTKNLSPEATLMQNIKKVTGSAYDTTQVINVTEQFFSTNLLPENKDSKMIIEKFSSVYPFLNNYSFNNELFMQVFDICLTLGTTYDQSVTLLKCACRHTHNFENNSEYSIFYENIKKCHQECNSIFIKRSPNISISLMLLAYKYPLNSKQLQKKFTHLKTLKENFAKFYANDLIHQISTPSSLANSSLIKMSQNINDYYKIIEIAKPVNYLQRFQNYVTLLSRIYEISNINIQSCFDVLQTKRAKIIDKVVFESKINPIELEEICIQSNFDLIFHLIMNCCLKIECRQVIQEIDTANFLNKDLNTILIELIETINKSNIEINNIHPPNEQMFKYIQKYNQLLSYLLILMYPNNDWGEQDLNTTCIDNLINLDRIQRLEILYESNKVITALQNYIEPDLLYKYLLNKQELNNLETNIKIMYSLPERQVKHSSNIRCLIDTLAYLIVNSIKSSESYKYAELITNTRLKVDCLLNNLQQWSGTNCIRILKEFLSNFCNDIDEKMKGNLNDMLNKIVLYEDIRIAVEMDSWYEVYVQCEKNVLKDQQTNMSYDPAGILRNLINLNKIDLVMTWLNSHSVDDCLLHLINADFIKQVLKHKIDFEMIKTILNQIPIKLIEIISITLLKSIRNIKQLQFLIEYITNLTTIKNPNNYHNIKIGIKLITILNPSIDDNIWTIIDQPLLILEQFLMNTKLEKLSLLIKSIKVLLPESFDDDSTALICTHSVDNLLRTYAEKALEFRIRVIKKDDSDDGSSAITTTSNNQSMTSSPNHLLQSIDSLNTVCSDKVIFVMPDEPPAKSEWMQDYDTNVCLCCHETVFSMFNRRHHCRRCGRVVCGNCSRKRLKISIYGDLFVRVCNQCYELTMEPENIDDNTSIAIDRSESDTFVDYWQLTNNTAHNAAIRDEFSFEYAPSVSLCLSILKLHSQNENYTNFLLNQCNTILRVILSLKVVLYNEIDYNMVFQMLRSLLVAAKVNSARNSYDTKLVLCDQHLGQIDILHLLAANDCLDLLPTNFVSENFKYKKTALSGLCLRKLRDNLMEHEKWNLALEISTKTGLDTAGVFAVWGKACLKAGCFQQAREIFQYCLDKVNEENTDLEESEKLSVNRLRHSESRLSNIGTTNRPSKNPALINEIIEILESSSCIIDPTVLRNAELSRNHKPSIKSNSPNSTAVSVGSTDSALQILNKLANLKNISNGNFNALYPDGSGNTVSQPQRLLLTRKMSKQSQLKPENYKVYIDQCIHNECIYYLRTYGSHTGLIEYYLQYRNVKEAVQYLQENKLNSEYYVELYVHCLKNGCVDYLQQIFTEIDSTLDTWKDGLRHICRYLEQNGLLNVLYQIQEWLGDHVRAAMTCIKFYSLNASSYTELLGNLEYLHKAQNHLKYELESDNQWVQVEPSVKKNDNSEKSLVLKMNSREIDKHINTIWRQIEITKFLASNEKSGRKTIETLPEMFQFTNEGSFNIPTLFGTKLDKIQLAVLAITSGENITEGFGIAFRIIQDFQLNSSKIYCIVAKQLAIKQNCIEIQKLVECIATSGISEDSSSIVCDELILLSIRTLCADISFSTVQIESLIKLVQDVNIKITAYIDSRQLKSAYLLAVRHDRIRDIRRILREAERLNQPHIRNICIKRLSQITDNSFERN